MGHGYYVKKMLPSELRKLRHCCMTCKTHSMSFPRRRESRKKV
ncbi:MAG: hypothetical protein ACEY3D_04620 [Rickettsia sp.]